MRKKEKRNEYAWIFLSAHRKQGLPREGKVYSTYGAAAALAGTRTGGISIMRQEKVA
jgi:hypothetical protein